MLDVMAERGKKVPTVAKEAGIPKDRIYKWLQQGNNPKAEDEKKINKWIYGDKEEKVPHMVVADEGGDSVIREPETPYEAAPDYSKGQILSLLAEAFRDQKEILKIHAKWLESIEKKMAQESTQAIIIKAVEKIETNLNKVLEAQVGHSAMFGLLLNRDVLREAGGNQEIAQEILKEILQKFGSKLNSDLKEGIGADGGNQDMKSS